MQFRDNTKPSSDIARPLVYILTHEGNVVNVYREYTSAVKAAIEEVTIDPDNTFVDNFDSVVYVDGCRGEVVLLVEELL